jgi:hypothetical protein
MNYEIITFYRTYVIIAAVLTLCIVTQMELLLKAAGVDVFVNDVCAVFTEQTW